MKEVTIKNLILEVINMIALLILAPVFLIGMELQEIMDRK